MQKINKSLLKTNVVMKLKFIHQQMSFRIINKILWVLLIYIFFLNIFFSMFQDNLIFKHIFMHSFFKSSFMFSLHLFLICPGVHVLYNCDDIYRTILFAYRGFLCCFVLIMMSNLHISHSQNVILNKNNVEKFHWTWKCKSFSRKMENFPFENGKMWKCFSSIMKSYIF